MIFLVNIETFNIGCIEFQINLEVKVSFVRHIISKEPNKIPLI